MNTICPHCQYKATLCETLKGEENPRDGDIGVCISCGEVAQFNNNKLTKIDLTIVDEGTLREIKRIQDAWLQTRHLNNSEEKQK